jgi:cytochrome c oxidase cbb3-type subunit 3
MSATIIHKKRNGLTALMLTALPFAVAAQESEPATVSYFSNALFNTLLVTIIMLAILIVALGSVMKNIINSDMFTQKLKKKLEANASKKVAGLVLFFSLASLSSYAGDGAAKVVNDRIGGIDQFTFYTMISVIILEIIFIASMLYTMSAFLKSEAAASVAAANRPKEKTILDMLSDAVDVENEESILLDHDYDGIKELDNNLPPWWKYGFYLTIGIAVVYLISYHITGSLPLQGEEYKLSVKKAEAEIAEFMKNSANNVDETTVKMLDNPADLAAGKEVFISVCSACHGKLGEGTVGPNLTDEYWLHGGSVKDIFKTIKYGYPDKGMKSWKEDYSPMQIAQLTSFIRTLKGTNPPKGKEKQGELYIEQGAAPADTSAVGDSARVAPVDTLAVKK